ncbi:MAG: hypothetical protein IJV82_04940 [Oscillospiraceae bacterium]|nr:hypothetical protein [Oscillospiraceae bacterium]
MDKVYDFIRSITPAGFSPYHYVQFLALLVLGMLAFAFIARLIFGKKSTLNHAVSASIAILCIYVVNVVVYSTGAKLEAILSPLPFVTIAGDYLYIFNLLNAEFHTLCEKVLDMVILAFLMNLLDSWLPKGKKVLGWYFFRFMSVVLAICLQYVVNLLLGVLVPAGFAQYAPMILLIILMAALLLGALKLLVGGALAFIDPLLGILYTFFFSTVVGKQLSKAILTTAILSGLICLMNHIGISAVYIASAALAAYIPLLVIVLAMWYVVAHLL